MAWRDKRIKKWTNKDVLDWIQTINLSSSWTKMAVEAIKESECTGADWVAAVKSKDDIKSSFNIKNVMLANKIYKAYKAVKIAETKKVAAVAADRVAGITEIAPLKDDDEKAFQLNIFAATKYWSPRRKVTTATKVRDVATIFKQESGVESKIEDIVLYTKGKVMAHEQTLGYYHIENSTHLINVQFKAHGGIELKNGKSISIPT
eukprot:798092_1